VCAQLIPSHRRTCQIFNAGRALDIDQPVAQFGELTTKLSLTLSLWRRCRE